MKIIELFQRDMCHPKTARFVLRAMEHCLDRNFRRRTYVNKGPNIYLLSGKTKDYKIGTNDTVLLSCIKICCLGDRMMFPNEATSLLVNCCFNDIALYKPLYSVFV